MLDSPTHNATAPDVLNQHATGEILFLVGDSWKNCGVSDFTRCHIDALEEIDAVDTFELSRRKHLWRDYATKISSARAVVCNLPVVAWKSLLLAPFIALGWARLRGKTTCLVLHEWSNLNPLRRLTYYPILLLASRLVMLSAQVRSELASNWLFRAKARSAQLIPLPPSLSRPDITTSSAMLERLNQLKAEGRTIIATFGSIYPNKNPFKLLKIAAAMKQIGRAATFVFVGDFVDGLDRIRQDFDRFVEDNDLGDDVIVTGFVEDRSELFGLFEAVDAFVFDFDDGLTARRSSVLAVLQAGRPVVTTMPACDDEFDGNVRAGRLIRSGAITLVPRGASHDIFADALLEAIDCSPGIVDTDVASWQRESGEALRQAIA